MLRKIVFINIVSLVFFTIAFSDSISVARIGVYDTPGKASGIAIRSNCAYLADGDSGFRIIDISNPSYPMQIGTCGIPGFAQGIAVASNYAYVAAGTGGLRVIDISDSTNPYEVGFFDTPGQTYNVALKDTLVFIADGTNGLRVVNVSNRATPVEIGYFIPSDTTWAMFDRKINKVIASGDYIYIIFQYLIGSYSTRVTKIKRINVSNPNNPIQVASVALEPAGLYSISGNGLALSDNYLFGSAYGTKELYCFDISDSSQFIEIGYIHIAWGAYCMAMSGNLAFLSVSDTPTNTLKIVDVNDPTSMREVGSYTQNGLKIMDIYCQGNYIYAAADTLGLIVLQYITDTTGIFGGNNIQNPNKYISNISVYNGNYSYDVNGACHVRISIYNIMGQSVKSTLHEHNSAGRYYDKVCGLSSGTYIIKFIANDEVYIKKMLMIK